MRKPLGKLGEAFVGLFPHVATHLLLLCAASFLALPDTANAQIWVTSGFMVTSTTPVNVSETTFTPGSQTETAYCSTSAVNPATGQPSPAAANYPHFFASCTLTPSGTTIISNGCPGGYQGDYFNFPGGNPTGQCNIVFQPQQGVTYTVTSSHTFSWYSEYSKNCGLGRYPDQCFFDPLGYFPLNYFYNTNPLYAYPPMPIYPGVSSSGSPLSVNTVDVACSTREGTCTPQLITMFYSPSAAFENDAPWRWFIAQTSEPWTPKCSDVVQGSVTPYTDGGPTITATFTPNFGFTLAQAAQTCGFSNFDWQQWVINLPLPSPMFAVGSGENLYAPPAFLDPPPGGYTSELTSADTSGNLLYPTGDNAFPYYLNPNLNPGQAGQTELEALEPAGTDGTVLSYRDTPTDSCLFGGNSVGVRGCNGSNAGFFETLQYTTCLVGINTDGTPYDLGVCFSWFSNFNGTSGGASTIKNLQPVDPGSGTGGVTVTSVNETTNYQYPKAPGIPASTLTFLDGTQISTTASGLAYSRVSKLFIGTLTITNVSENTIVGPFQIVLNSMPTGVTLANATGSFGGWPYITVPNVTSLEPGQSASVKVQFSNPEGVIINSIPMIFGGSFE